MPTPKPKMIETPFRQSNTYAPMSIADTPEAKALLDAPIDPDPGAGNTDLAEQAAENRANSAFNAGTPRFVREHMLAAEKRGIRAQGAREAASAKDAANRLNLERRRLLLPQIMQTESSGFNSQAFQQPSLLQSIIGGAAQVGSAAINKMPYI